MAVESQSGHGLNQDTSPPSAAASRYVSGFVPVLVALCVSVTGTMLFKVLPLVVGAAARTFDLEPAALGALASSDLAGIAVASVLAPLWVRRVDWRHAALAALMLVVCGNLASTIADKFELLLLVRFITGLGEGTATGLALVILSDTRDPDRSFGLAVGAPVVVGLVGFQVLPPVVDRWGFDGLMIVFAGLAALIASVTQRLPARGRPHPTLDDVEHADVFAVFSALLATAVYHAALGAVWAFIERIGAGAGIDGTSIGRVLGIAVVFGFAGAMAATGLGTRAGRIAPIVIAVIVQLIAVYLLADDVSDRAYFTAACLFQFCWLFAVPYQLGVIASADRSGRFFVLTIAFQAGGVTLGPLLAGLLVSPTGFAPLRVLAAACMLGSLVILLPIARRVARS